MKLLALGLMLAALAMPAAAHQYNKDGLNIVHPSSRPAAKGMTGVGYLTVNNSGSTPDVLLRVESPVAAKVEIHQTTTVGSVSKMKKLKAGVPVPAKGSARLEPGGVHIMLMKLKQPLVPGDKVPATLVFKNAGRVDIHFLVQRGSPTAEKPHHH